MELCNCSDLLQEKMNELFNDLNYLRTYKNDKLIISNKSLENHVKKLG